MPVAADSLFGDAGLAYRALQERTPRPANDNIPLLSPDTRPANDNERFSPPKRPGARQRQVGSRGRDRSAIPVNHFRLLLKAILSDNNELAKGLRSFDGFPLPQSRKLGLYSQGLGKVRPAPDPYRRFTKQSRSVGFARDIPFRTRFYHASFRTEFERLVRTVGLARPAIGAIMMLAEGIALGFTVRRAEAFAFGSFAIGAISSLTVSGGPLDVLGRELESLANQCWWLTERQLQTWVLYQIYPGDFEDWEGRAYHAYESMLDAVYRAQIEDLVVPHVYAPRPGSPGTYENWFEWAGDWMEAASEWLRDVNEWVQFYFLDQ